MELGRSAMRQCLSRSSLTSIRLLCVYPPRYHRFPILNHCPFSSTKVRQKPKYDYKIYNISKWRERARKKSDPRADSYTRDEVCAKIDTIERIKSIISFGCVAVIIYCLYDLYSEWNEGPRDKVFDPPRFTPFSTIKREQISTTSMILTLRPRRAESNEYKDPYKECWEKGTWSVEVKQPELQIARSYTPLPPKKGDRDGDLRFLIRKELKGEVSGYLHSLHLGGQVELRGPKTEVELPSEVTDVVFLAGGTGIAPALQVVYTLLERRKEGRMPKIRVVWANRKREDCVGGYSQDVVVKDTAGYIARELQALQKKYPDNLQVDYLVDDEGTFLDQKRISPLITTPSEVKFGPVTTRIDSKLLFVSGPEGFVSYLAGPKRWDGGKEGQGELGGVLRRMGVRDWKIWKL
jgi:cytochrome-b5 reductase